MSELLDRYGPVALVTGASSGIGAAYAELLAQAGLDLVLVARRQARLQTLAQTLGEKHGVAVTVCVADLSQPQAALATIAAATAGLDVGLVISNAGFGMKGAHQDNDPATAVAMLNVNCQMPMLLTQHFIPRLLARGKGGISLTGSVEGFLGFPYSAPYSGSKAFIMGFGEALWGELQPRGIDVLVLCPSSTDTEALDIQGVDKSQLDMMSAEAVAQIGLDNLRRGPVVIAGEDNDTMFRGIAAMDRKDALKMMGEAMQASLG